MSARELAIWFRTRAVCIFVVLSVSACSEAARAQTDRQQGEIPGDRGRLIEPFVPGPPTYTDPNDRKPEDGQRNEAAAQVCDLPSKSYLDPRLQQPLPNPDPQQLYSSGWLAGQVIGGPVFGKDGEQLGEVLDILVGPDQRVTAIAVEGGGFLEIGDGAFRVPWSSVDLTPSQKGIAVHLSREEAARRGLFNGPEQVDAGEREFRISEVKGDWTRLGNETNPCSFTWRGYVRDVVLSNEGRLLAVLETRSAKLGGGTYAYPFFSYQHGWRPFYGYYDLPLENMMDPAPKVELSRFGQNDETTGKR